MKPKSREPQTAEQISAQTAWVVFGAASLMSSCILFLILKATGEVLIAALICLALLFAAVSLYKVWALR